MENRRESGKGIQGWTVRQRKGPLQAARAREERNWREILEASRSRIARLAILLLAVWGGLHAVLGLNGWLHLRALRAQEAALAREHAGLLEEFAQVDYELREDPGLSMERVLREQYRKSLPNEIVIRAVPVPAAPDSAIGSPGGPAGGTTANRPAERPPWSRSPDRPN